MKQIVDKHTIIRLIKPEDNSVESIKKEINKNICSPKTTDKTIKNY